jgi:hypothetical protein
MGRVPQFVVGPPCTSGGDDDVVHRRRALEQLRWSGPHRRGSESERWSTNLSLCASLCGGTMDVGRW